MFGQIMLRPVLGAIRTWLPAAPPPRVCTLEPDRAARYSYTVWLRHLVRAVQSGLRPNPTNVVELGPGASLGAGLTALLTGSETYAGIDAVAYVEPEQLVQEFARLTGLVERRAHIPYEEFPSVRPLLDHYAFPAKILPDHVLDRACAPNRLSGIEERLALGDLTEGPVRYGDWDMADDIAPGSADFIFSHAVMQDVADIARVYEHCARWLRTGGFASHVVDFRCQGLSAQWNGYWAMSDTTWQFIRARRPYVLNRLPLSAHLGLLAKAGMEMVAVDTTTAPGGIERHQLSPRFAGLTDSDLVTAGAHILARKL